MPISGLILTLADQPQEAEQALRDLAGDKRFELGPRTGQRQPVTLATQDSAEDKDCWHWLQSHPGIGFVDVACVFFEDETVSTTRQRLITTTAASESSEPHTTRSRPW